MKTQQNISIEDYLITKGMVSVDYVRNDDFLNSEIEFTDLINFVENRNMNELVMDVFEADAHTQHYFTQDPIEYTYENLTHVLKEYLLEYPLISATAIMETLEAELNKVA